MTGDRRQRNVMFNNCTRLDVPHKNGLVQRAGDHVFAAGREGDGPDAAGVALQFLDHSAVLDIPDKNGLVSRAGDHVFAAGRESDGVDAAGVLFESRSSAKFHSRQIGVFELLVGFVCMCVLCVLCVC